MASFTEVGTKLGQPAKKKGSMRDVIDFMNQNRGKLISLGNIFNALNYSNKDKQTIENCYHKGYILKGNYSGNYYYFVPDLSEQSLETKRNEFLQSDSTQKLQLIETLIQNINQIPNPAPNNPPNINIPNVNPMNQNQANPVKSPQQHVTGKQFFQKEIQDLKMKIKTLEKSVLQMNKRLTELKNSCSEQLTIDLMCQTIIEEEIEIEAKQHYLAKCQEMLLKIP